MDKTRTRKPSGQYEAKLQAVLSGLGDNTLVTGFSRLPQAWHRIRAGTRPLKHF